MKRFVAKYLDPASRLGEILFGLIMVLTVTLTAGLTIDEGPAGVRQLLFAAIGCNLAWGIIDAVMYFMNCVTVRSGKVRLVEALQRARDTTQPSTSSKVKSSRNFNRCWIPEEREAFSRSVLNHVARVRITSARTRMTKDDFYGAARLFLAGLCFVPASGNSIFHFFQPHFALRVSNFLLIALLFLVGQKWAQYAGTNRLVTGSAMVAIGLVLVGVAILLGG